ncbi:SRPBCC family protein [Xanthobacter autotrophicus]|uniref:SRPBCC family protein n=1 Tax=Xanthobacter TaxID=279 RepID=UPI0024AC5F21|nr:SRPBCC family protein [Xanthobacter autotrophicus]MDI4666974.1 SRPBCC family protein [Xanthobacter autotrophicus]
MKLLLAAAAAFSLALLPVAADAHGPTRKKVTESVEINAPADKVWAAIGNFQDMGWHPAVTATAGQGGNAVDATRKLTLQGGGTIDEVLYKFEPEQKSYSYRITEVDVKVLPVTNYSSTITVTPIDGTHSKVEWRGAFYRGYPNNDPPPELSDDAAIAAVTGVYRSGLDALKAKLEKGS